MIRALTSGRHPSASARRAAPRRCQRAFKIRCREAVFAYLTWREAGATVKLLRLMAEEQQEALAQQRAQHRLAQLERIGADVAAARADLVSIEFSGGRASGNELKP